MLYLDGYETYTKDIGCDVAHIDYNSKNLHVQLPRHYREYKEDCRQRAHLFILWMKENVSK